MAKGEFWVSELFEGFGENVTGRWWTDDWFSHCCCLLCGEKVEYAWGFWTEITEDMTAPAYDDPVNEVGPHLAEVVQGHVYEPMIGWHHVSDNTEICREE